MLQTISKIIKNKVGNKQVIWSMSQKGNCYKEIVIWKVGLSL